jgi:Anti-sigma-K factor rskA, C-terminal
VSDDDEGTDLVDVLASVLDEAPPEPPADRVAALRARAEAARDAAPWAASARRRHHRAVFATAAAAVFAGFALGRAPDDDDDEAMPGPTAGGDVEYVGALAGPSGEPTTARLSVVRTGIGRVLELDTVELPILPVGQFYEVWFVAPDDSARAPRRISAGTFHPDPDGRSFVRFAAAVDPTKYPTVEITAEPGDGDPAASGSVVLRTTMEE